MPTLFSRKLVSYVCFYEKIKIKLHYVTYSLHSVLLPSFTF
jgi:hypothetical protein